MLCDIGETMGQCITVPPPKSGYCMYRPTHRDDGRALDQPVVLGEDGEIKFLQDGAVGTARERRGGGEGGVMF